MRTVTQDNLILSTDSYKVGHHLQYPQGMTYMSDYFESRGGARPAVMFFGLQYYLIHYLQRRITAADVAEARALYAAHFGTDDFFPFEGWMRVVEEHEGRLPIRIRAVPEGRMYGPHVPLFVVESLDPKLFWLVSWVEGLLQKVWYPTTVASLDFHTKLEMYNRLAKTSDNPLAGLLFMLHDFGYRGTSSEESARVGGGAALVNFLGSDTVPALLFLADYYGSASIAGFSVAAMEHSTVTTWGRANEAKAYANMMERFGKQNIVSIVVDSYDPFNAVSEIFGAQLRKQVQQMNATLVVRPDSGDPAYMVSELAQRLDDKFGSTLNSKGYKVLNKVRIIQGDGINHHGAIPAILDRLESYRFSAENVVFGMGGGRLQDITRDSQRFAIKCSLAKIDGEFRQVYKQPVTDMSKSSMHGYVDTIQTFFGPRAVDGLTEPDPRSMMRTVYEMGDVLVEETLDTIRARAYAEFNHFANVGT